jgi:hypothetical protein
LGDSFRLAEVPAKSQATEVMAVRLGSFRVSVNAEDDAVARIL